MDKVELPSTLTKIGINSLAHTAIDTLAVPESLETIASSGLSYTNLRTLVLPEGFKEIGATAFRECTQLASIALPSTLESIGANAFKGCTALTEITCLCTTPPTLGSALMDTKQYEEVTLYVPAGTKEAYAANTLFAKMKEIVELPVDDTAIRSLSGVANAANASGIYNLNGQRTSAKPNGTSHHEILIIDGKKLIR